MWEAAVATPAPALGLAFVAPVAKLPLAAKAGPVINITVSYWGRRG